MCQASGGKSSRTSPVSLPADVSPGGGTRDAHPAMHCLAQLILNLQERIVLSFFGASLESNLALIKRDTCDIPSMSP